MCRSRPPADGSNRICRYTALAPRNSRFTPASRAASVPSNMVFDQYSSWPSDTIALCWVSSCGRASTSVLVMYVTSRLSSSARITTGSSFADAAAPSPPTSYGRSNDTIFDRPPGPPPQSYREQPPQWVYACQVLTELTTTYVAVLASSRTVNGTHRC